MSLSLTTMDITDRKEKGIELHNAIALEAKRASKSKLFIPIPNLILMTSAQYDDLNKLSGIQEFYHTEDKLYVTPYNVMEVRVEKPKRLTFTEAHSLDDKTFTEWENSNE